MLGTIDSSGDTDFYEFWLNAGQSTTLAATGPNGNVGLGLFDANGNLLTLPSGATSPGPQSGRRVQQCLGPAHAQWKRQHQRVKSRPDRRRLRRGGQRLHDEHDRYRPRSQTSFDFQVHVSDQPSSRRVHLHDPGEQSPAPWAVAEAALGYYGIGNSIAIKFDYYNNAGEGTDSTGLFEDGAYPDVPAIDLSGTGVNISSGDLMNVAMSYNGSTLNVTITDLFTNASASQSYSVNIPAVVGSQNAFVGFTGGTGGLTSIPAILNWTYTPGLSN